MRRLLPEDLARRAAYNRAMLNVEEASPATSAAHPHDRPFGRHGYLKNNDRPDSGGAGQGSVRMLRASALDRRSRDERRNHILRARGWYVVRLSSKIIGEHNHQVAVERIAELARDHRRAIVLARSDLQTARNLLGRLTTQAPTAERASSRGYEDVNAPPRAYSTSPVPPIVALCPRCTGPLVRRQANRGPNAGGHFYGCSNFPRCRYTQAAS